MVRTKQQRKRNRRRPDASQPPVQSLTDVDSVEASGATEVTITFASPVMISPGNLPTSWVFGTANRTLTVLVSSTGTVYVFTTSGSVAAAQTYSMPGYDPAARTTSGGYVADSSGTMT